MAKGRAPREFVPDYSSNVGLDFELWLEDANDFLAISNVTSAEDKKKWFLILAGLAVRKIVKGLVVATGTDDDYKVLTDAVLAHFRSSTNVTAERHRFRRLLQHDGESVTAFVGRLRERVDACEFSSTSVDTVANCQVRDQFIAGLKSTTMRVELLKEAKLTLAQAITKAVALEASVSDSKLYEDSHRTAAEPVLSSPSAVPVHRVSPAARPGSSTSKGQACKYCGRAHAKGKRHCPSADAVCRKCGKIGHFASVCLSRTSTRTGSVAVRPVEEVEDSEVSESRETDTASRLYESAFAVTESSTETLFRKTLTVNGHYTYDSN